MGRAAVNLKTVKGITTRANLDEQKTDKPVTRTGMTATRKDINGFDDCSGRAFAQRVAIRQVGGMKVATKVTRALPLDININIEADASRLAVSTPAPTKSNGGIGGKVRAGGRAAKVTDQTSTVTIASQSVYGEAIFTPTNSHLQKTMHL